ncbi:hypothetical protein J7L06_00475 [Candidatus Bathyarchaeota archaeon]|nr:hypothetical protein [Candidatus Bathyarchaeota archaeon]
MKHLRVEVKVGRRSEWCDECYNYVNSKFFVTITNMDGEHFTTLCDKHARELAEVLVRVCWVGRGAHTPSSRRI